MPQSRRQLRTNRRAKRTSAPWKVAARKPRGGRRSGTIPAYFNFEAVRAGMRHNRAMVERYSAEPVQMAASLHAHAYAAAHRWHDLLRLAIAGHREAQQAVEALCAEFGVESPLDLINQRFNY